MNARRLLAITRKEFLHLRRDVRSTVLSLALPLMLLGLFGWALSLDVDQVPTAVWDRSGTATSRSLVAAFTASRYFKILPVDSYGEIQRDIDLKRAAAAIVIPQEVGTQAAAGHTVRIQEIVNGADPVRGGLALSYAEAIIGSQAADLAAARDDRLAQPVARPIFEVRTRVWFNPNLESRNGIIPGVIAMVLANIGALMTALTVAREWETGTMESLLSTPVTGAELIIGKLVPYVAIGMANVVLAVTLSLFVFRVPLVGPLWLVFAAALIFTVAITGFGILVSTRTRAQLLASELAAMFSMLPTFLLSGLVFAIADMPPWVQFLSSLFPARYFVTILRDISLKGLGPAPLAPELLALSGFAFAMVWLAVRSFRRKLA